MTPADFPEFHAKLVALSEMFDKELSESLQALYFDALSDLPIDSVCQGIGACIRSSSRFMPKPAEIREAIFGGAQDREAEVEVAWLEYKRLARVVGGYGSPTFEDGALGATIAAVFTTWEHACWDELSPEMWSAKRKEFGRVYRVMRERGAEIKALVGAVERDKFVRGATEQLKQIEGEITEACGVPAKLMGAPDGKTLGLRGHLDALRRALPRQDPEGRANVDHSDRQGDQTEGAMQALRRGAGAGEHRGTEAAAGEADAAAPVQSGHAPDRLER